jgi:hypothetical protein
MRSAKRADTICHAMECACCGRVGAGVGRRRGAVQSHRYFSNSLVFVDYDGKKKAECDVEAVLVEAEPS